MTFLDFLYDNFLQIVWQLYDIFKIFLKMYDNVWHYWLELWADIRGSTLLLGYSVIHFRHLYHLFVVTDWNLKYAYQLHMQNYPLKLVYITLINRVYC